MPVSADTLRKLMAAGLEGDALLDVVASIDADGASIPKVRTAHALRQERYRERKASQTVTSDASRDDIPSPKEAPHTPEEITPSSPSTQKENPLRGQKKGSRLPDDFEPDFEFATALGLSRSQAETEFAKFRDYWAAKSGQGATKRDWQATWRNWVRTAAERMPRSRAGPQPQQPKPPQLADVFKLLKENGNGRQGNEDQRGAGAAVSYLPAVRSG